ncbi:MAG TPA: Holliday junction resolvase [Candidatus Thermoplasmatota archaeon]|nr:Holliday junction resolvase [Candidatus Thermoplasmatota archaeon]
MSSVYERELKGILGGEEDMLRKITKTTAPDVTARYLKARQRPFLVVRGAGSLGVDLVALRGDVSFPIEVKSASSDVIRFSDAGGRNGEQAEQMMRECSRASVIPLYAFRRKGGPRGDPWRVLTLPTENLPPRIAVLYERIPKVDKTTAGNWVLRWDSGMPLSQFVDYLCG